MKGCIYVVGIGPGDEDFMSPRARKTIIDADVVIGYSTYLDLIAGITEGKDVRYSGMTREVDRCEKAVEIALEGKKVALVCGGDPNVYSLAGLVFEVAENKDVDIEVIPGITAATAAAAVLGAPLIHDFAIISLSDLLTPWDKIEKRLQLASAADFVIVLYNPKSKGRPDNIKNAADIMLKEKSPDTLVGIVRSALRGETISVISTLGKLADEDIDMFTTVVIGNAQTKVMRGKLVTPRGYHV